MVKYISVAAALKAFSAGPQMRGLYRKLGNRAGNSRRMSGPMPRYYIDRVERVLRILSQHKIVRDGDRVIELGTGWLHWEALTLRLLVDVEAVLFDVWDNRQLGGLKNYVNQLLPLLKNGLDLTPAQRRLLLRLRPCKRKSEPTEATADQRPGAGHELTVGTVRPETIDLRLCLPLAPAQYVQRSRSAYRKECTHVPSHPDAVRIPEHLARPGPAGGLLHAGW